MTLARCHALDRFKNFPLQRVQTAEDLTVCYLAILGGREVMERGSNKYGKKYVSTVSGFNLVKDILHIFALSICTSHRGFFADGIKETLFFGPYGVFIIEVYT